MINNMNYFKKKLKVYYIIFNFQVIIGYQNNKWYVRNFNKSQKCFDTEFKLEAYKRELSNSKQFLISNWK